MRKADLDNVIIPLNSTIGKAIDVINRNGVRGTFVCDDDRELLGIIMDSDIRRAVLKNFDLDASIKTIMKTSPFVISEDIPDDEKKRRFAESGKMLVPVVGDQGNVVDYISLREILTEYAPTGENTDQGVTPPQSVLIIGGAGYIGSVLSDKLIRMGYKVKVLDLLIYGKEPISYLTNGNFSFTRGDCRDQKTVESVLGGIDAVIHLAEIVGDPACQINESFTIDTNYAATQMIVESCVKRKIRRFIFASSCSVYGHSDEEVEEESGLNPVSLYARCKIESEKAIQSFDFNRFCPTIMRLATVHGKSFRQRFDLVVNLLVIKALAEKRIQIFGGEQWRPFISVQDVCYGFIKALQAPSKLVKNQIFNLGDSRENYQLKQIGDIIGEMIPQVKVETLSAQTDNRNYRVNFDKIRSILGFTVEHKLRDTVRDISTAYELEKRFRDYTESRFHNVLALKE